MCGIAATVSGRPDIATVKAMLDAQAHRGPDGHGVYVDDTGTVTLGHRRLSIIDLSDDAAQPMWTQDRRLAILLNGEIYNYIELRRELSAFRFRTASDTEVALAAYDRWGEGCLERFIGMFALVIWDAKRRRLFAARDRFGVKPLYYAVHEGALLLSSEIKGLHAAGVPRDPDVAAWATYLKTGSHDHCDRTFWKGVRSIPAGYHMIWESGRLTTRCWYDLGARIQDAAPPAPVSQVEEEYLQTLLHSVQLRFRADVDVGISLSGGLDSSVLLGAVDRLGGTAASVRAFTFVTGSPQYDELPWVERMLARTGHELVVTELKPDDVPTLAADVMRCQDEPFGGIPTLAYARLCEAARRTGTIVLLDGQGMDEQWAGYDYYARNEGMNTIVQGKGRATRPECLAPDFAANADPPPRPIPSPDRLLSLQLRDIRSTKLPRALRFNDRTSMRASIELREPFLDHRLVELALRQPADRKIRDGVHKWLLRGVARQLVPSDVRLAPKRPVQTPQREWLAGPLRDWTEAALAGMLAQHGGSWLLPDAVWRVWREYVSGANDNSYFLWQWISLGLALEKESPIAHV